MLSLISVQFSSGLVFMLAYFYEFFAFSNNLINIFKQLRTRHSKLTALLLIVAFYISIFYKGCCSRIMSNKIVILITHSETRA